MGTSICATEQDMVFLSLLACGHRRFYGRLKFVSVGYESSGFVLKIIFSKIIQFHCVRLNNFNLNYVILSGKRKESGPGCSKPAGLR